MKPWDIKRFSELVVGDPEFRAALPNNPEEAVRQRGLDVQPAPLRCLWDPSLHSGQDNTQNHPDIQGYFDWRAAQQAEARGWLLHLETATPRSFRSWRTRQANRFATQAANGRSRRNRLLPFAIELTRGCSIACPYCGLAAPRLSGIARFHQEDNAECFAEVLQILLDYIGPGAAAGFLYWATEPFDNPDYEHYLKVYARVLGIPAQTTTAAWRRNPRRTRAYLHLKERLGGIWDRFSINSLQELHELMDTYSAFELRNIEVILQNPGSLQTRYAAGRARSTDPDGQVDSIACVSGFLINMVDRSIKLISPCTDFDRWPLGYAVYREADFGSGARAVHEFLQACDKEAFQDQDDDGYRPVLRNDVERTGGAGCQPLVLRFPFGRTRIAADLHKELVNAIDGRRTVHDLVVSMRDRHHPAAVYHAFHQLYQYGLFEHLPEPAAGAEQRIG